MERFITLDIINTIEFMNLKNEFKNINKLLRHTTMHHIPLSSKEAVKIYLYCFSSNKTSTNLYMNLKILN